MARKIRIFCEACKEEIVDRTYSNAHFCKECFEDYRRHYKKNHYRLNNFMWFSMAASLLEEEMMEVEEDEDRNVVSIQREEI